MANPDACRGTEHDERQSDNSQKPRQHDLNVRDWENGQQLRDSSRVIGTYLNHTGSTETGPNRNGYRKEECYLVEFGQMTRTEHGYEEFSGERQHA